MTPSSTFLASIAVLPNRQYEHRQVHVLPSRAHVLCYQHPVLARRTVSASRQSPQRPSYRVSVLESLSSHVQPCIRNDHVKRTIAKLIVNAGQSETVNKQCIECSSRAERPKPKLHLPTLLPKAFQVRRVLHLDRWMALWLPEPPRSLSSQQLRILTLPHKKDVLVPHSKPPLEINPRLISERHTRLQFRLAIPLVQIR
jgi:hypothetical protein